MDDALLLALPPSLPALAWALCSASAATAGAAPPFAVAAAAQTRLAHLQSLVPAFKVATTPGRSPEAAAHVVRHAADRLRRLNNAYGQWQFFDAAAYFDLTAAQTALLVQVVERVRLVHVTFHIDLLLPGYQAAVRTWATQFAPAHNRLRRGDVEVLEIYEQAVAAIQKSWHAAVAEIQQTRRLLAGDIGYLAANGAAEERARWAIDDQGCPKILPVNPVNTSLPTLTLTADFPLPLARQPGRLRRLRRHRDRNLRLRRR